jgi:hypothetical protein
MALTFGTLLSSQGADAHVPQPIAWPFFVAVNSTLHQVPRQSNLEGSPGGFPGFAARSVLAWCMENDTRPQGTSAGGSQGPSRARPGGPAEQGKRRSGHPARPELDAHPGTYRLRRLGDAVFPRALAGAAHHHQVAVTQGKAQALSATDGPQQQRAR